MEESAENIKNLANILKNGEDNLIKEAIESLRNEEPFSGAVKMLAEFYNDTLNSEIKKTIEKFFNDIKNNTLKKEIVETFKLQLKPSTIKMIVSSCWQSGLDYSDYQEEFAELFVISDFETALECLTVIEEISILIDADQRTKLANIIGKTENKDTKLLAKKLIDIILD